LLLSVLAACSPPRSANRGVESSSSEGTASRAQAGQAIPVWWSTSELGIARLSDIDSELAKPFEGGITLSNAEREKALVADCATARDLQARGFAAQYPRDISTLGVLTAKCLALEALRTVKPARMSFLPTRPYSASIIEFLPAALAPTGSAARAIAIQRATAGGQPIRMVEVTVAFEAARDEEILIKGEGWQETLTLLGRGDFDADGKQDWLLRADLAMEGGTNHNSRLFLMSRDSPDEVIAVKRELKPGR